MTQTPPKSEDQLLKRARALAGQTVGAIAKTQGLTPPPDLKRAKGWIGQLIEEALGADGSSKPQPDFSLLDIELKTIPIDPFGKPVETTFVCTAQLPELSRASWQNSLLKKKLARVLWIPIETTPGLMVSKRHIGAPLLWSPNQEEEAALAADWEELTDVIVQGFSDSLTAHRGRFLQIRPKARHSGTRRWAYDHEGSLVPTRPRGFYLRKTFTQALLTRHLTAAPRLT